jgi:signal transduction histidine kinase
MVRRRPRPIVWLKNHPRAADALLAALLVANVVITWFTVSEQPEAKVVAWVQALGLIAAVSSYLRRKHPVAVLGGSGALVVVILLTRYQDAGALLTATVAAYSVGAHVPHRKRRVQVAAVVGFALVDIALISLFLDHRSERLGTVLSVGITCAAGFLLGDNLRSRRERLAHLRERNDYLERAASLEAANAAAAERSRIARELHDIVAHSVSVIAVQAGGARRLVHTKPDTAVEALTNIEQTARETLRELRQLLGVLRSENAASEPEHAPQPGLDDVPRLIDADPDLPVQLAVEGERRDVPGTVNLAGYRIVQEALTNVRKHAGPAKVDVHLSYLPDRIEINVSDNGRGAAAIPSATGPGFGLTGMRERAALCGGAVASGPRAGGGWTVRATLPTADAPTS